MMEKDTPKLCNKDQFRVSSCLYPNSARRSSSLALPSRDGLGPVSWSIAFVMLYSIEFEPRCFSTLGQYENNTDGFDNSIISDYKRPSILLE